MKRLILATLIATFASTAMAETNVVVMNYTAARIAFYRSVGIPFLAPPNVQVFAWTDDASITAFNVTLTTPSGVMTEYVVKKGSSAFAIFSVEANGPVSATVECVKTVSVVKVDTQ